MKIILALTITFMVGCTNPEAARHALENAGFSEIKTDGYGWFDCGKGDFYSTEFTAKNPLGRRIQGTVCTGLFKNSTIRF